MIEKLTITNLKGISKCKLENLGQINLFVGKNNSCKSTILEAIVFGIKEFSSQARFLGMLTHRTNVLSGGQELWYNYETKEPINVVFEFRNAILDLKLNFIKDTNEVRCSLLIKDNTSSMQFPLEGSRYSSSLDTTRSITFQTNYLDVLQANIRPVMKHFVDNCSFLESSAKNNVNTSEEILGILKTTGLAVELGKYLQQIYNVGENWEFLPCLDSPKQFRAATLVNGKQYYLSGLGDGFRFAVPLLGFAMLAEKSALAIEEIETSQHPEALKKLIPILVELCKKNNLQLFVTAQNPVVWAIFEQEFKDKPEDRERYFRCFHVQRNMIDGVVTCTQATKENYDAEWSSIYADLWGA